MGRPINKRFFGEPTSGGSEIKVQFHNGTAAVTAGEMTITVKDDAGALKQVTKISGRMVTLDSGDKIAWNFSAATDDGAVEMEEAGTADDFTDADDFEVDGD